MIRPTTLFAAAALVLVPVTVAAEPVTTAEVRFDDLNLSSSAGQNTLETRISAAVRKVCNISTGITPLREQMDQQRCVSESYDQAMSAAKTKPSVILAAK